MKFVEFPNKNTFKHTIFYILNASFLGFFLLDRFLLYSTPYSFIQLCNFFIAGYPVLGLILTFFTVNLIQEIINILVSGGLGDYIKLREQERLKKQYDRAGVQSQEDPYIYDVIQIFGTGLRTFGIFVLLFSGLQRDSKILTLAQKIPYINNFISSGAFLQRIVNGILTALFNSFSKTIIQCLILYAFFLKKTTTLININIWFKEKKVFLSPIEVDLLSFFKAKITYELTPKTETELIISHSEKKAVAPGQLFFTLVDRRDFVYKNFIIIDGNFYMIQKK
jgi:hypothetical protein